MNRKSLCLLAVPTVLVLSLTMLPSAEARGLANSRPAAASAAARATDWWSSAAAWVAGLLHVGAPKPAPGLSHQSDAARTVPATTNTDNGLCIDPNGGSSCS